MAKYSSNIVRIGNGVAVSGRILRKQLEQNGYTGESINWGHTAYDGINTPDAIHLASNKRKALETMRDAGVPIPTMVSVDEVMFSNDDEVRDMIELPVVGRKSYHTRGSDFYFCNDIGDMHRAVSNGATHFLQFIEGAREFRVHVVDGKSIKISEKHKEYVQSTGVFNEGSWTYPESFRRKISLRRIAIQAVEALGLDFGAVDILYKKIDGEPRFFVLEVNTCPALTNSKNNDTLERYVRAFLERSGDV